MFLVTIFLTNTIDQKIYGEFRLAFAFISLLSILLLFGRDTGLLYYTQIEKDELKRIKLSQKNRLIL